MQYNSSAIVNRKMQKYAVGKNVVNAEKVTSLYVMNRES